MKINVYNLVGKVVGDVTLPESLFGFKRNDNLVHQVYLSQSANRRSGSSHKKNRGDVSGGGKKPWKQKGTGHARVGSSRNPLWKGGGVVFGPTNMINFSKSINVKMKRKALMVVLSEKFRKDKIKSIDSLVLEDKKTKFFSEMLNGLDVNKSALMVFSENEKESYKAARNLEKVNTLEANQLNVFDLMNAEYLIVSKDSINQMVKRFVY